MTNNAFALLSLVITIIAFIAYINYRFFKLPTTTAIMVGSLILSLFLLELGKFGLTKVEQQVFKSIASFDFHQFLIQIVLCFMLFAGALNIPIKELWQVKAEIAVLAIASTVFSAILIAWLVYYSLGWLGFPISFVYCLIFGALISPTDPIAVLALFKALGAEKKLEVIVAGESLFNDGVGIVLFSTFYQLAFNNLTPTFFNMAQLFSIEFFGGIFLGLGLGAIGYKLMIKLKNIKIELLITLAVVMGGYSLASTLGVSGPLAMVAAGIFIGTLKGDSRHSLYDFWEMVDEILNSVLFFMIGLELVVISHSTWSLSLCLAAIGIVLFSRGLTVSIPIKIFKLFRRYPPKITRVLWWGGLRGGLAVALALSLPESHSKSIVITLTYSVVVFSIIVQGLTVKPMIRN